MIGEVAGRAGISTRMLRHYDRIGLVSPTGRSAGGYRQYSEDDVRRLLHAEGLRSLGLSLPEVVAVLDDLSFSPEAVVEDLISRTRERLARDQELLHRLQQVRLSGPTAWSDVLRTIALLRGIGAGSPSQRQRSALKVADEADRHVGVLVEAALEETDPAVAGAIHWALARTGDAAVPVLAGALRSADPGRRHRAVAALEKLATPAAGAALAELSDHPDPVVAARATLARGRSGSAAAVAASSPWWRRDATTWRPPTCWRPWPPRTGTRMRWPGPSPTP
nr:MerR family transcriptional regulator [Auraticoccus cholistanensis]